MFHQLSNVEKCVLFLQSFDLSLSWYNEEKGYYSAIRRYHNYKKYWQPIKDQTLDFQLSCNKIYLTKFRKNCGTLTNEFSSYKIPSWQLSKNHWEACSIQLLCFTSSTRRVRHSLTSWNLHGFNFAKQTINQHLQKMCWFAISRSPSPNQIRSGKSKERKGSCTVSKSKRLREYIQSFFSAVRKTAKATQEASPVVTIDESCWGALSIFKSHRLSCF